MFFAINETRSAVLRVFKLFKIQTLLLWLYWHKNSWFVLILVLNQNIQMNVWCCKATFFKKTAFYTENQEILNFRRMLIQ